MYSVNSNFCELRYSCVLPVLNFETNNIYFERFFVLPVVKSNILNGFTKYLVIKNPTNSGEVIVNFAFLPIWIF